MTTININSSLAARTSVSKSQVPFYLPVIVMASLTIIIGLIWDITGHMKKNNVMAKLEAMPEDERNKMLMGNMLHEQSDSTHSEHTVVKFPYALPYAGNSITASGDR